MGNKSKQNGFEHGLYYYGEGFTPLSDEIFRGLFTHTLSKGEISALLALNCKAWEQRKLVVRAAATFIPKLLPIGRRTIQRHFEALTKKGFIRLHQRDHTLEGNHYFVEPVFIWSSKWHELEGIEISHVIQWDWSRQNGATDQGSAETTRLSRQNGATSAASTGTGSRQNGADPRSRSSDRNGAAHHSSKTSSGGGAERPGDNGGPGQRSPNGQDRNPGKKGAPAGRSERPPQKRRPKQMTIEEQIAWARAQEKQAPAQ